MIKIKYELDDKTKTSESISQKGKHGNKRELWIDSFENELNDERKQITQENQKLEEKKHFFEDSFGNNDK